jgi:hypothetical protein
VVEFNGSSTMDINANVNNYTTQVSEKLVSLSSGTITLGVRMYGYAADGLAAHVGLVSLR